MRVSLGRVLGVTLGLSLTGAICGGVLASTALLVDFAFTRELSWREALMMGGMGGAIYGAILAPMIAWIFLRRVSFARAIAETALGVLAGIAVGAVIRPELCVFFGLGGFVVAGISLWFRTRRLPANRGEPAM